MRLARDKLVKNLNPGKSVTVKKISEPEFIIYAKEEIATLLAEGVSNNDPEKIADLLEVVNSVCEIVKIDWYECQKIKSSKRWEEGNYNCLIASKND